MSTSWINICLFASCSYASSGEVDKSLNSLRAGQFPPIMMGCETTEGKTAWRKTVERGEFKYTQPCQKNKCYLYHRDMKLLARKIEDCSVGLNMKCIRGFYNVASCMSVFLRLIPREHRLNYDSSFRLGLSFHIFQIILILHNQVYFIVSGLLHFYIRLNLIEWIGF